MRCSKKVLLFCLQVNVLEARDSVGGRVQDDTTLGVCISKGPQIITGCINNPMYIMNRQVISMFTLQNLSRIIGRLFLHFHLI